VAEVVTGVLLLILKVVVVVVVSMMGGQEQDTRLNLSLVVGVEAVLVQQAGQVTRISPVQEVTEVQVQVQLQPLHPALQQQLLYLLLLVLEVMGHTHITVLPQVLWQVTVLELVAG
jgi:hypothetical protein